MFIYPGDPRVVGRDLFVAVGEHVITSQIFLEKSIAAVHKHLNHIFILNSIYPQEL